MEEVRNELERFGAYGVSKGRQPWDCFLGDIRDYRDIKFPGVGWLLWSRFLQLAKPKSAAPTTGCFDDNHNLSSERTIQRGIFSHTRGEWRHDTL